MIRKLSVALVVALLVVVPSQAGKYNKVLSIGDAAPDIKGLPSIDDKTCSMSDMKDKDVIVVAFTCNHCPVAVAYEDRMIEFAKKFTKSADSKVGMIAVCVNDREDDKLEAMKVRAKKKGFNFTYVYDESGAAGKAYGATKTPEFFVLNKERKIVYMGSLDDSQAKPTKSFLDDAIKATLDGKAVSVAETQPVGCGIVYKKK